MNLLNVRFYLYERALFHPTKCAAGAMLGTALQLIGWRPLRDEEKVDAYELPKDFRNVGDAVFLHDLTGGAKLALSVLDAESGRSSVELDDCRRRLGVSQCSQVRIAALIVARWSALPLTEARESVRAGSELLGRVMARRFYKAVFRNLPNSKNTVLRKKPEQLAETFKDPILRFHAERKIERRASLRLGSVVIHCPRLITAQKVANVLLVFPTIDGKGELPAKLRNISELDPDVFGAHEKAILAVERMYESMWRLVVYVAPEALAHYPLVTASAGKVVFDTMDEDGSYPEEKGWENDKHLTVELERKFGGLARQLEPGVPAAQPAEVTASTEASVSETMVEVHAIADETPPVVRPADVVTDDDSVPIHAARRQRWVATVRKAWRADVSGETPRLVGFYDSDLSDFPDQRFEELLQRIESEYEPVPKNRRPQKLEDFLGTVVAMRDGGPGRLFQMD
jgi:hypothetical protein